MCIKIEKCISIEAEETQGNLVKCSCEEAPLSEKWLHYTSKPALHHLARQHFLKFWHLDILYFNNFMEKIAA